MVTMDTRSLQLSPIRCSSLPRRFDSLLRQIFFYCVNPTHFRSNSAFFCNLLAVASSFIISITIPLLDSGSRFSCIWSTNFLIYIDVIVLLLEILAQTSVLIKKWAEPMTAPLIDLIQYSCLCSFLSLRLDFTLVPS